MMKKKKCPFKKNAYSLLLLVCGMLLLPSIVLAEGKETGIYYFRESWIQDQELLKATFPADPLIPMQSNPVHYLRRGAKAVEILDIGLDHSGKEYHLLSLYDLIPVLAVNRDTTKAEITGWSDLNKYDLTVGIDSNSDMLLLGMSQGLDKDWRQIEQSKKLMQDLHTRGKLLFSGNQGFTAGKLPDVMILFDKQARALQASGANLEIVFPSEGTVAFPVALLSKKPLHLDTTVLQAKLSEAVYQADRNVTNRVKKIDSDYYAAVIRAESMINRELIKSFRPLRTNKYENSISYVILLCILGTMGTYFYFRVSDPVLRRYTMAVFLLLCFWIIIRMARLLSGYEGAVHRYTWYLYYVALLYVPMLFLWIALHVDGRISPKRMEGVKKGTFAIASFLLLLVLTNDLHEWIFVFEDDTLAYRHGNLMLLIGLFYAVFVFVSAIILVKRAIAMPNKTNLLIPVSAILALTLYTVIFVLFLNNKIATELTRAIILFVLLIFLSMVQFGLIPLNTKHGIIFQHSNASMLIRDLDREIALAPKNESAYRFYVRKEQPIRGGTVLWLEDRTELQQLFDEEAIINDKLEENYRILQKQYEVERDLQTTHAKTRLQEQITSHLQADLQNLDHAIRDIESGTGEIQKRKLSIATLELMRIKHSSHFLMVYLMEGHIQVENFLLSIQAITKLAQGMGIRCDFTDNMQGYLSFDSADRTLAWLIHSMKQALEHRVEIGFYLQTKVDVLSTTLYIEKKRIDKERFEDLFCRFYHQNEQINTRILTSAYFYAARLQEEQVRI